jgi:hypothetical protein
MATSEVVCRAVALTPAELRLMRKLLARAELSPTEIRLRAGLLEMLAGAPTVQELKGLASAVDAELELDTGGVVERLPGARVVA